MYGKSIMVLGRDPQKKREVINQYLLETGVGSVDSPDCLRLGEEERSIGIDEIRKAIKFLAKKPARSKTKLLVISEAKKLTQEAQNSLLKTLEEPNQTTTILLLADSLNDVLETISSRCQKVFIKEDFSPDNDFLKLAEIFIQSGVGERLSIIEENKEAFTDRATTLKFLDHLSYFLRNNVTKDTLSFSKKVIKIQNDLAQVNINPRLSMEYLALG